MKNNRFSIEREWRCAWEYCKRIVKGRRHIAFAVKKLIPNSRYIVRANCFCNFIITAWLYKCAKHKKGVVKSIPWFETHAHTYKRTRVHVQSRMKSSQSASWKEGILEEGGRLRETNVNASSIARILQIRQRVWSLLLFIKKLLDYTPRCGVPFNFHLRIFGEPFAFPVILKTHPLSQCIFVIHAPHIRDKEASFL